MDSTVRLALRVPDNAWDLLCRPMDSAVRLWLRTVSIMRLQLGTMDRAMDSTRGLQLGTMDSTVNTHSPCAQTSCTPGNPSLSGTERCSLGDAAPGTALLSRLLWERLRLKGSAF